MCFYCILLYMKWITKSVAQATVEGLILNCLVCKVKISESKLCYDSISLFTYQSVPGTGLSVPCTHTWYQRTRYHAYRYAYRTLHPLDRCCQQSLTFLVYVPLLVSRRLTGPILEVERQECA